MKYCLKCNNFINENNKSLRWCMIITKKGNKIIDFQCFHAECWEKFFKESVLIKLKEIKG